MFLECLILRVGVTPVTLGSSKVIYRFMPIPGSKKDEMTTSVCDVTDEEHIKYLLKTKQYRPYDEEQAYKDLLARRKERIAAPSFTGFRFEKYHDVGHICVDERLKQKRYLDSAGWHDTSVNLMPFKSEIEAFDALKEEVQFEVMEAKEKKEGAKDEIKDKPPASGKTGPLSGGKQATVST